MLNFLKNPFRKQVIQKKSMSTDDRYFEGGSSVSVRYANTPDSYLILKFAPLLFPHPRVSQGFQESSYRTGLTSSGQTQQESQPSCT